VQETLLTNSNILARFGNDESGSYLMTTAIMMPVLMGIVGLGTDYGLWIHTSKKMQNAADTAAYSAALAKTNGSGDVTTQANALSSSYGFVNGSDGVVVSVNNPPTSGPNASNVSAIEVVIQQPQKRFFSASIFPAGNCCRQLCIG
jgi:Flp pilus assembly protein TadG